MKIFRDIPGHKWKYQANKIWEIKSLKRNRLLKPWKDRNWYTVVKIWEKASFVHRAVLLTFKWPSKLECNHKNWIKDDNRLENLEYCTKSQNTLHKYRVLWYKNHFHTNNPCKWKFWKEHPTSQS